MEAAERLARLFAQLQPADRETVLALAQFLADRSGVTAALPVPEPQPTPRPPNESVVAAIKRLSADYHMVDRAKMLHETSALMGQHLLQGRGAVEVIDELEIVFRRHYERQFGNRDAE